MPRKQNTSGENYNSPFPTALRKLIREHDTKQDDLIAVFGVKKRQSITGYTDGSTTPDAFQIRAVADYYGVSTDYLLGKSEVSSVTAEMTAAAKYTGLSEKAVSFLHTLLPNNNEHDESRIAILKTVSFLLENPSFYRTVIDETRFALYCSERQTEWEEHPDNTDLSESELDAIDQLRAKRYTVLDPSEMANYQCNNAARAFSDFLFQSLIHHAKEYNDVYSLFNKMWLNSIGIEEE